MKKICFFFLFIFFFLTQFVNAQSDPNRISQVWATLPGMILGIENMDDDPEKEMVVLQSNGRDGQIFIYNTFTGIEEWRSTTLGFQMKFISAMGDSVFISQGYGVLYDFLYPPQLVDFNEDGVYEILICCKVPLSTYSTPGNPANIAWRLLSFRGSLKAVKPIVK